MIELFRFEPNAESLALLMCLAEKGVDFDDVYVDVFSLEHHDEAFLGKCDTGSLPLLVVDDDIMTDAGLAMQYLEEAFDGPAIGPADPGEWYDMQAWLTRLVGPFGLGASVNLLGWEHVMTHAMPADRLQRYLDGLAALPKPPASGWTAVQADAEKTEDPVDNAIERIEAVLALMEADIAASGWLAGGAFSIADIHAFSHAHCLPSLMPERVNADKLPAVTEWLGRISTRPATTDALGRRRLAFCETTFTAPG